MIAIPVSLFLGIVITSMGILPEFPEHMSEYALDALLITVGLGLGSDREFLSTLRKTNPKLLALPLVTIVGSLVGGALCLAIFDIQLFDALAVSSGMGYYSLSTVLIQNVRGAELGAVALVANVVREVGTLVGAGLIARFHPYGLVGAAGAAAMDTCLPVITKNHGSSVIIPSMVSGAILSIAVPILVEMFI